MKEIILQYGSTYLIVHFAFALFGLIIELINTRYLKVRDLFWAGMFGVFYFLSTVAEFDRLVIDLRPRDKK